ncbi:MAG: hypothetical protein RBU30_23650, partial [Polyangia bacterium]|nr:hypothetical protein [Polyangia bacterium]
LLTVCLSTTLLGGLIGGTGASLAGCKKPGKAELTPAERCQRGCERRLQCVEELALDKAVTEANREHLKRSQSKSRKGHLGYCLKACNAGQPRFEAFARCGVSAKDCDDYFKCESAAAKDLEAGPMPADPPRPTTQTTPTTPPTP